jgi:hypothetical protein
VFSFTTRKQKLYLVVLYASRASWSTLFGAKAWEIDWDTVFWSFQVFRGTFKRRSTSTVLVLYSVVLQVLWSTSTSQYWSISTLTMMYSAVLNTSQYWFCSTGILWSTELLYCTNLHPNYSGVLVHLITGLVHLFYDVLRYCTLERQFSTIFTFPGSSRSNPCVLNHGKLHSPPWPGLVVSSGLRLRFPNTVTVIVNCKTTVNYGRLR